MDTPMRRASLLSLALLLLSPLTFAVAPDQQSPELHGIHRQTWLPPGPDNPRNSEGSFIKLKDGRLFFAYSKFMGSDGGDFGHAMIVGRYSSDDGYTWAAQDVPVVQKEGAMNVMSVSLLRLKDGRIALFYARKNSESDLLFYVRFSSDETRTWSGPTLCTPGSGYFVMNNDRAIQLRTGRILLPVSLHTSQDGKFSPTGTAMTYLSDDGGVTWRRSATVLKSPIPSRAGLQEPGVIELKNGQVLMFLRTQLGSQYLSYSNDHGDHWSDPQPSVIASPLSNAAMKRIPSTEDILLVWNDHTRIDDSYRANENSGGKRTPVSVAVSRDDGRTWIHVHHLLADPDGWYSYFALYFVGDRVLLAFCATGKGQPHLSETDFVWFKLKDLYAGGTQITGGPIPPPSTGHPVKSGAGGGS